MTSSYFYSADFAIGDNNFFSPLDLHDAVVMEVDPGIPSEHRKCYENTM